MSATHESIADIRTAGVIATAGNAFLATVKVAAGIISGSAALLGDGIDSIGDVLIGAMTLVVARIISKPADAEHPWGHGRAEAIATAALAFIIFFLGAQLAFNSAVSILSGEQPQAPTMLAVIITIVSIVGKIILARTQFFLGKRAGSAMIIANAKNMTGDVLMSIGVLVGLAISTLTGSGIADRVLAFFIGLWIVKTAIGIFMEANLELMDGNKDLAPYQDIFDAVNSVEGAERPHHARMRSIGGFWDIDLDIDVDPDLTVRQGHDIAIVVEHEIRERLENIADIMIHIEPAGHDHDEVFGVSEETTATEDES